MAEGLLEDVEKEMDVVYGKVAGSVAGDGITQVQKGTLVVVVFYIVAQIYKVWIFVERARERESESE